MKKIKRATTSTKKPQTSLNPALAGLTSAEYVVYLLLQKRQKAGKITRTADLANLLERDRSNVFRSLQALIGKEIVERYGSFFYRIKQN